MNPGGSVNLGEESLPAHREVSVTGHATSVEGTHLAVTLNEWDQIRSLDLDMSILLRDSIMVDLKDFYRPDDSRGRGFRYASPSETGYPLRHRGCIMQAFASEEA
jgi:hypothetical protein